MIRTIAIIGTGTMGRGISYLSAVAGYDTILYDADTAALDAAALADRAGDALSKRTCSRGRRLRRVA